MADWQQWQQQQLQAQQQWQQQQAAGQQQASAAQQQAAAQAQWQAQMQAQQQQQAGQQVNAAQMQQLQQLKAMQAQQQQQQAQQQRMQQQQQQQQQAMMQQQHMQQQQQQQMQMQQQQSAAGGPEGGQQFPTIVVGGCQNATVANIIVGTFQPDGMNHGKPVFKKEGTTSVDVRIYFWDDRDGPTFSGWWFGPKVGGDQVWAYSDDKQATMPPLRGWKVPWDGPVDESLALQHTAPGTSGEAAQQGQQPAQPQVVPGKGQASAWAAQSQQQQWQQKGWGQQPQQQQQQGWGQQAQKGWGKPQMSEEQRQQQEAQRLQFQAEQKKKMEEEKQRIEEQKKKQQEREEEMARRQAELQKKREEEEQRRAEHAAALVVRKVIQRVRIATPDNYDGLRAELEKMLEEQLEKMGAQAEKVQQEAEKALLQAQERVDEITQKRLEAAKRKEEEELRKKEEAEKLERLGTEAATEVQEAESQLEKALESVKLENDATPESILDVVEKTSDVTSNMHGVLDTVSQSLSDKRDEMGNSKAAYAKLKGEFVALFEKLGVCRRKVATLALTARRAKEKADRKLKIRKKDEDFKALFEKYDKDKDGKLARSEIVAYSKGNHDFELTPASLDKICRQLCREDNGVPLSRFSRLKAMVCIARSEVRARVRRAEEAEKEKKRKEEEAKRLAELEKNKAEIQKVFDEATRVLDESQEASKKAEEETARFDETISNADMSATELEKVAASAAALAAESKEKLTVPKEKIEEAEGIECADEELQYWRSKQTGSLKPRIAQIESQLARVESAVKIANEKVKRKAYTEMELLRTATVTALRVLMSDDSINGDALFERIAGSGASQVAADKFATFLRSLPSPSYEDGQAERLFKHVTDGADELAKEKFLELIRLFYKVTKSSVLTTEVNIKSKTIRRLDVGEIVEGVEAPKKEEEVGVTRMKCKTVSDGEEGYVTISGNQGTVFLEPGGNTFKCVKETFITEGLSISDSKNIRKIKLEEVVDVIEFEKLDESCNVKRIKIKAKVDGATGWVSVAGNQGTAFMVPC